jgi:hypothetical protein
MLAHKAEDEGIICVERYISWSIMDWKSRRTIKTGRN